jgi:hypothetical protein
MFRWKPSLTIRSTLATCALMALLPAKLQSQVPVAPPPAAYPPSANATAPYSPAIPTPPGTLLYHFQERRQQRIQIRQERRHDAVEHAKSLFGL